MVSSGLKYLFVGLLFFSLSAQCALVDKELYIISDSLETVHGSKMPYITFNDSDVFTAYNPVIELQQGDSLRLWVFNQDSIAHEFQIINIMTSAVSIPSMDSVYVPLLFSNVGNFIYHDPLQFPKNTFLGLGGMIVVKDHAHDSFYWNIKEHDEQWSNILVNNGTVNWSNYQPEYFTINANSNPNINMDTTARIVGNVGDTLMLYIANTGQSIHSMHFHGYHGTVMYSSKNSAHHGWEKDTYAIYPMETVIIRIVPDKEGEYPVHDHNLVAVTGNNLYPNGMFTTILIAP